MTDIPIIMGPEGRVPTPVTTLQTDLIAGAVALDPTLTATLPGTLIEDIASTDTAALVIMDNAITDIINSVSPSGANEFILDQLAAVAGVTPQPLSNTSVYVVFYGTVNFVVPKGFIVGDGTYQYVVQDGGIIGVGGQTLPLYALANTSGSWAVPANTVTTRISSIPDSVTLTVNNPNAGTPSAGSQLLSTWRAVVLQAYSRAAAQGMPTLLRTLLQNVPGVQQRLISIIQRTDGYWEILVGGGDPIIVAYAIFKAIFDVSILRGSDDGTINVTVAINDFPNTYTVKFVSPPAQTVTMTVTWNTDNPNYVNADAVTAAVQPAIVAYITSIYAGQPINVLSLNDAFSTAVSAIFPVEFISALSFAVYIDGVLTPPTSGTNLIYGRAEGYFTAVNTGITVTQA